MNQLWNEVYRLLNVNEDPTAAYNKFFCVYKDAFEFFFRNNLKAFHKMTPRHEWMTKGLLKSSNKKSKLYKKYRLSNPPESKKKFITYQKI